MMSTGPMGLLPAGPDTLCRCMPSRIRKVLNELPITLDDTYERILQGIPKEKWQLARQLFPCYSCSDSPTSC
jgi:hypothetical protein